MSLSDLGNHIRRESRSFCFLPYLTTRTAARISMRKTVPIVIEGHKDMEELTQPPWRYASDLKMNVPIFQGYSSFPRKRKSRDPRTEAVAPGPRFRGGDGN